MRVFVLLLAFYSCIACSAGRDRIDDASDAKTKACFNETQSEAITTCLDKQKQVSETVLSNEIKSLKKRVNENYDDPYHLDDADGDTINDVFISKFNASQAAWEKARDALCDANASLMGEWAATRGDSMMVCEINMNSQRVAVLKMIARGD